MTDVLNRKPVHTMPLDKEGWGRLDELFAEGRRWVKMNCRSWPAGHDLYPQVRTEDGQDWIDFYFVPTDSDVSLF